MLETTRPVVLALLVIAIPLYSTSAQVAPTHGVTRSNLNPLQIATLHWYDANLSASFSVGSYPSDVAFDGGNIWVTNVGSTHYVIGSCVGPAPYPRMVRDFQSIIGREAREQMLAQAGALPTTVIACVGGGSNAIGVFHAFIDDPAVQLVGVEAAGEGLDTEHHAASLSKGTPGVLHGTLSYLLQDAAGQVHPAHSISAGLDYPGVGPEHAYLKDIGRATYVAVTDHDALEGFKLLSRLEGIVPALESAHAVSWLAAQRGRWRADDSVLVCVSGRGDKDVAQVSEMGILAP